MRGTFWKPLFFVIIVGSSGGTAWAQTCVAANPMANSAGLNRYRVNVASFDALEGISRDEVVTAAIRGAEVWNELGNAGYFQFMGSTSETLLPARYEDCAPDPVSTIVLDENNCDGTRTALVVPSCEDSGGNFHGWTMVIFKRQGFGRSCFDVSHTVVPPHVHDLVGTFAHEFGHTLGLGHPSSGFSTMRAPEPIGATTQRRELSEWDIRCLDQLAGYRNGGDVRRYQINGALQSEQSLAIPFTSYLSVGLTRFRGAWEHAVAFKSWGAVQWNANFTSSSSPMIASWRVIGPVSGIWPEEDPSRDRVFYSSHQETPTEFGWGKHPLRQVYSTDGFQQHRVYGSLHEYGVDYIHSGRPIAVAWDDYNDKTITLWVNQTRSDGPDDREVRVSLGSVGTMQVNTSASLGVQSAVTPGIACAAFRAGGWDCVVAYVPPEDTLAEVWVRRFWTQLNGRQTILHLDPEPRRLMGNTRTASRIAVWRHADQFWVAMRPMRAGGQKIELFSSTDGATWAFRGNAGFTAIGPSAVSYPLSINVLAHSR